MKKLFLVFPLLFLFSCNVQKRKYQKGFYVSAVKHKKQIQKSEALLLAKEAASESLVLKTGSLPVKVNEDKKLSASASEYTPGILKLNSFRGFDNPDSLCDLITLRNGEEVSAKVLEITPIEVKYKKCNSADGPLYIAKKTDVFMIKYSNGTKEVFKSEPAVVVNANSNSGGNKYNANRKMHPMAVIAFILAILGLVSLLGAILGLILAKAALKKIKENPNVYKGEALADSARIISKVILIIYGVILAIVLLAIILSA